MSRQKTIDQTQLFYETEQLILEAGYTGFHFKALAERLGVARSTIYNYYPRKEELITAYMLHLIEEAVRKMDDAIKSEEPLKTLLRIWVKYANMHQMLQIMPYIDQKATPKVEENTRKMYALFREMKKKISDVLYKGQQEGQIRTDIQMPTLVGLMMATVQIPVHHTELEEWVNEVHDLLLNGFTN
ncbi:TetR/AcrR family transcriptional regulator [Salipaludibacillus agaradhaerens]|uniref:TetR/AcrR family transcriptional regulator n=1 Tax=Salipaludibacillus agaradhaerens TaxID=76935 RepID=UPI002150D029|nr:TetR/AcrR family transcriptional regulator [Salipaludibacillus agaradhaerens]MCR6105243.1 TetR/AcrR family transcriptional regulator [Salipaludibacillus agaradhaerens]MCR6117287.1 TetR/AcrR family transcriptional regulator [Salipaludibacillus agaradhaerens]